MAPLYSDIYIIKEVKGNGWTYVLTSENGSCRDKIRHFNDLKEVSRVKNFGEIEMSDSVIEIGSIVLRQPGKKHTVQLEEDKDNKEKKNSVGPPRRSDRNRTTTKRLTMELSADGKRYVEKAVHLTEDMDSEGKQQE